MVSSISPRFIRHAGTGWRADHLPADLDLETADLVLKRRSEPGIRVQIDTLAVTGIGGRRVADDLEVDVALGQEAVVEVIDRQPEPHGEGASAVMPTSSIAAIQRSTVEPSSSAVGHWFGRQSHPRRVIWTMFRWWLLWSEISWSRQSERPLVTCREDRVPKAGECSMARARGRPPADRRTPVPSRTSPRRGWGRRRGRRDRRNRPRGLLKEFLNDSEPFGAGRIVEKAVRSTTGSASMARSLVPMHPR